MKKDLTLPGTTSCQQYHCVCEESYRQIWDGLLGKAGTCWLMEALINLTKTYFPASQKLTYFTPGCSFLRINTYKNKPHKLFFNLYLLIYSFVKRSLILTKFNGISFALYFTYLFWTCLSGLF